MPWFRYLECMALNTTLMMFSAMRSSDKVRQKKKKESYTQDFIFLFRIYLRNEIFFKNI
jgi:hypothetical protein